MLLTRPRFLQISICSTIHNSKLWSLCWGFLANIKQTSCEKVSNFTISYNPISYLNQNVTLESSQLWLAEVLWKNFPDLSKNRAMIRNLNHNKRCKTRLKYLQTTFKSSHRRCSVKRGVLENFAIFKWKHLCWNLFLMKLEKSLKIRLWRPV